MRLERKEGERRSRRENDDRSEDGDDRETEVDGRKRRGRWMKRIELIEIESGSFGVGLGYSIGSGLLAVCTVQCAVCNVRCVSVSVSEMDQVRVCIIDRRWLALARSSARLLLVGLNLVCLICLAACGLRVWTGLDAATRRDETRNAQAKRPKVKQSQNWTRSSSVDCIF